MLQSPFLSRIGGSSRVRDELTAALAAGRGVTAKIRWIPSPVVSRYSTDSNSSYGMDEGRTRWIHCTPLRGHNGAVGVWMVVLIDEDGSEPPRRRFKTAPPVAQNISSGASQRANGNISSDDEAEFSQRSNPASTRGKSPAGQRSTARKRLSGSSTPGTSRHPGTVAEWERARVNGEDTDGNGSMRSFALM